MRKSLLDVAPISRIRRNHGLEHATLHVLGARYPHLTLGGISSPNGFTIVGNVTTEDVADAAIQALKKLQAGEASLAMHANCGTNFAVSGIFAGAAAWLGTLGAGKEFKQKVARLPLMMVLAVLALIATRPLGPLVQKRLTTSGDPEGLELERVETALHFGMRQHRVITKG